MIRLAYALPVLFLTGCLSWFSDQIGTGVARLTVRNIGAVATLINNDSQCGFASPDVANSFTVDGEVGGYGVVTWTITGCVIDLPQATEFKRDCNNEVSTAQGTITVSASRSIKGRLTGNPAQPVIPETPDAVTISLGEVRFKNFEVRDSKSESYMKIKSGTASASVMPRMAKSVDSGVCAISTPNVAFSDISLRKAEVFVHTADREFDVDVKSSSLFAQNGKGETRENWIQGAINVFDKDEKVPEEDDKKGLDPDYKAEAFERSYACTENLAWPMSTSCELAPTLAQGSARLTIKTLGALIAAVNNDVACGFASQVAADTISSRGTIGDDGGDVTYSLPVDGCVLNFATPFAVATDCNGVTTYLRGAAIVTGTKTVTGFLTGDPSTPIVPTSRDSATISIRASLTNLELSTSEGTPSFLLKTGELRGTMQPRTALDTTTGACTVSTPVATFSNVALDNAEVLLTSGGNGFDLRIDDAALDAQNGQKGAVQNHLSGSLAVDGERVVIPVDSNEARLDPEFHQVLFDQAYQCDPNMIVPTSDEECSFRATLGAGVARLALKTFGVITKHLDDDIVCGFSGGALIPTAIDGDVDSVGSMRWDTEDCVLGATPAKHIYTDCNGKAGYMLGTATVTSTKLVNGRIVLDYPPIEPQDRESVRFDHTSIVLSDLSVYDLKPDELEPEQYLVIHSGSMSGVARPVTGESASKPGSFHIKTPLSTFEDVNLTARVTLASGNKRFNLEVDGASLSGFNGSYLYRTNSYSGTLVLDGQTITVPLDADDAADGLDPAYDQATFDASYACKEDLKEVVPASPL